MKFSSLTIGDDITLNLGNTNLTVLGSLNSGGAVNTSGKLTVLGNFSAKSVSNTGDMIVGGNFEVEQTLFNSSFTFT